MENTHLYQKKTTGVSVSTLGRKPELSLANKLLLYKTILKPIWTYDIPLWRSACPSDIEILQRFRNKVLGTIVNVPWYIPNRLPHTDLHMSTVRDEITKFSTNCRAVTTYTSG
jgi:hypothetical protein